MKKYVSEDQELIRAILGKDKFLMLNMNMVKVLNPNCAVFLTYLLDKAEYLLSLKQIKSLDNSFYVYRREFNNNFGLSSYQQRQIESKLKALELIEVVEMRKVGETWNDYKLNIDKIYDLIEISEIIPHKETIPTP